MTSHEDLLNEIRAWLREEVVNGKEVTMHECPCCKGIHIHVHKADWQGKRLWTCYNCGSSALF